MRKRRQPSPTAIKSLSVSSDLEGVYAELQEWVAGNSDLSLSRYLITAAALCQRLGIADPETADINALWAGEIYNPASQYDDLDAQYTAPQLGVTMDEDAAKAFDKLF